jgi:hypothetical protein
MDPATKEHAMRTNHSTGRTDRKDHRPNHYMVGRGSWLAETRAARRADERRVLDAVRTGTIDPEDAVFAPCSAALSNPFSWD